MAFRKKLNRHDCWKQFVEERQGEIASCGLPMELFKSEATLIEFLSKGESERADLGALSTLQFAQLQKVLDIYFFNGWEQRDWTAFQSEAVRRAGGSGGGKQEACD